MDGVTRAPALEMNGKETEIGPSEEMGFQFVVEIMQCQMTRLLLVICSMTLARRLQTHASPKLVLERETWRWPCAAERSRERATSWVFDWQLIEIIPGAVPWTAMKTRRQSYHYLTAKTLA